MESGSSYQIYEIKSLQLHRILNKVYDNKSEIKNTELEKFKLRGSKKKRKLKILSLMEKNQAINRVIV